MIKRITAGELTTNDVGYVVTLEIKPDIYIQARLKHFYPGDKKTVMIRFEGIENVSKAGAIYTSPEHFFEVKNRSRIKITDYFEDWL